MLELKRKFIQVRSMGWIKSEDTTVGGIGNMFERLINKPEDNFPVPDYKSIEIKTINRFGNNEIHLFSIAPDGDYLFPMKRVLNILGYPDRQYHKYKVLNVSVNASKYKHIGYNHRAKLVINRMEEKVDLIGYDNNDDDLNINVSWSFKSLEERLKIKLMYLAVIYGEEKNNHGGKYYNYKWINFYQLNSFDTFLTLLEKGIINVNFKVSYFKSGKRFGTTHDRGTDFSINAKDIEKLYTKLPW
ncbi:MAG: MvaI/BcnI restriction endonuclease family protein [Bacilli bacterium]|nr:MvaI/BcnI restriction endonuclease family protein [Bacilli bacterium]